MSLPYVKGAGGASYFPVSAITDRLYARNRLIGKKFQNVKNALDEAFTASLESAKWKLWHGNVDDALTKLALLRDHVSEEA